MRCKTSLLQCFWVPGREGQGASFKGVEESLAGLGLGLEVFRAYPEAPHVVVPSWDYPIGS